MPSGKRTFTSADHAAHQRLRALWDAKARSLGLTQAKAAALFGGTQALINAYLTGRAALGRLATLKFANILQVRPQDIRADFIYSRELTQSLPDDVLEMASKIASLPESQRRELHQTIDLLLRARHYEAVLKQAEAAQQIGPRSNRRA